jgi:hypothetical protein
MSEICTLESIPPLMDSVPRLEAQAILHIGHNKLYELFRLGLLDAVKDGPRTFVTVESIKRYQASRPRAIFKPPAPKKNNFNDLARRRASRKGVRHRARRAEADRRRGIIHTDNNESEVL